MGAQVSRGFAHLFMGAHGRYRASTALNTESRKSEESPPTAGELIRQALMDGDGKRTLARRLAAPDHSLTAVERWRAVVVRAERGGEPAPELADHVGQVFGVKVQTPTRPAKTPSFGERMRRLEELEEALDALGPELARLSDRVEELELKARARNRQGEK